MIGKQYNEQGDCLLVFWKVLPKSDDIQRLKNDFQDVLTSESPEMLLRKSHRSYPDIVLGDREIWIKKIQTKDEKANLALSAEETNLLQRCQAGYYPLFINGRPGSGKSTVLQYFFAEHLHDYTNFENQLNAPPIYLTYSQRNDGRERRVSRCRRFC